MVSPCNYATDYPKSPKILVHLIDSHEILLDMGLRSDDIFFLSLIGVL